MTISRLVEKLLLLKMNHGDVEVYHCDKNMIVPVEGSDYDPNSDGVRRIVIFGEGGW